MEFLLQLLLALVVLFLLARLGSAIVSRFGIPGLIGEIVIGIVVANLAFGDWSLMGFLGITMPEPGQEAEVGSDVYHVVYAMVELGVIFLLFTVGLETKVKDLIDFGKVALPCAVLGVVMPFIAGFAIIMMYDGNIDHALFLAAAMVATSVGITARIIKDTHLMYAKEARIIIAAAVIDDILGMIVLAIVNGIAASEKFSVGSIAGILIQTVIFVIAIIAVCKWVVPRVYDFFDAYRRRIEAQEKVYRSMNKFVLALVVCLFMSAFAEYIGLAAIIGAFLAGMLFADYTWEWNLESKFDSITTFMLSFFFLHVGLQVDLGSLTTGSVLVLTAIIIMVAVLTKYIGCGIGAKLRDRSIDKKSFNIIGIGMVPRGEVGIIVASIGLSSGFMSSKLYAVVVLMSVVTTIVAPPILVKLFKKKYHKEYSITVEDRI